MNTIYFLCEFRFYLLVKIDWTYLMCLQRELIQILFFSSSLWFCFIFFLLWNNSCLWNLRNCDKEPGFKIDIQKLSDETFCSFITEENKIYVLEMCYNIQHVEWTMPFGNIIVIVDNISLGDDKKLQFFVIFWNIEFIKTKK